MKITLGNTLPPYPAFIEGIRRAPDRSYMLTPAQTATALKNALRYIPLELHEQLAPEFMEELRTRGRPNRRFTNKVSMMIFNLEVININGYICFLYVVFLNKQIFAIYADKFITNKKTSCIDKTPALNVERVIISCYNFFTINCEMNKLVHFAHISLKNSFRCGFKRVGVR